MSETKFSVVLSTPPHSHREGKNTKRSRSKNKTKKTADSAVAQTEAAAGVAADRQKRADSPDRTVELPPRRNNNRRSRKRRRTSERKGDDPASTKKKTDAGGLEGKDLDDLLEGALRSPR